MHRPSGLAVGSAFSSQSKLNQKTEFEADLYGIYFAGLANYEPAKALGFFEIDKATGAKPERKEFATKRSNWLATNIKNVRARCQPAAAASAGFSRLCFLAVGIAVVTHVSAAAMRRSS